MDEVLAASALEQGRLIREKKLSSVELVRAYLRRIAQRNVELNAFVQVSTRRSLLAAHWADATRTNARSPLHGVPIGIKDLNAVRGMFWRAGSAPLRYVVAPFDDVVVKRVKRAGLPILGKTATAELGTMAITEPLSHPPTRNPVDPRYTAGGSSGGAAAAVGGGLLPIAHGSDGAGSLRIPAAFCGLVGFKTSRGLVPNPHAATDRVRLSTNGPIARSVEDAAAFIDIVAASRGDMLEACNAKPPRLQVHYALEAGFTKTDPEHAAAVERVIKLLAKMGHAVSQRPWFAGDPDEFLPLWKRQTANVRLLSENGLHPLTDWFRREGRKLRHAEVAVLADRLKARAAQWFGGDVLWVSPTTPCPPPLIGAWAKLEPLPMFHAMAPLGAFTAVFNLGGQPAVSMPVGRSKAGLPIGVQIAAPVGADALLFSVARALEREL